MRDYTKALEFLEKSLDIKQATLPSDHQDVFNSFTNIGLMYWSMGEYAKALPYYERAIEIGQRSLPQGHPYLQAYQTALVEVQKKL